jgi:hypothetical protein
MVCAIANLVGVDQYVPMCVHLVPTVHIVNKIVHAKMEASAIGLQETAVALLAILAFIVSKHALQEHLVLDARTTVCARTVESVIL